LTDWPAEALARRRAVMPQSSRPIPLRVAEAVSLGRSPHRRQSSAALDAAAVAQALEAAGIAGLADRVVASLSGGERQRVTLARALAQLPAKHERAQAALLLDEPTAALDPAHQHAVMSLARRTAAEGATVIAVLHDINLALQYADDALLLRGGRATFAGPAAESLTAKALAHTYGCSVRFLPPEQAGARPIAITGQ
jgi:iron complex transport system ATP-binding protein